MKEDPLFNDKNRVVVIPPRLQSNIIAIVENTEPIETTYLHLESGKLEFVYNNPEHYVSDEVELEDEIWKEGFVELDAENYVEVPQMETYEAYNLMVKFSETIQNFTLKQLLNVALDGKGAFGRFKRVLDDYPTEHQQWIAFRDKEIWEYVVSYFKDHHIVIVLGDEVVDDEL